MTSIIGSLYIWYLKEANMRWSLIEAYKILKIVLFLAFLLKNSLKLKDLSNIPCFMYQDKHISLVNMPTETAFMQTECLFLAAWLIVRLHSYFSFPIVRLSLAWPCADFMHTLICEFYVHQISYLENALFLELSTNDYQNLWHSFPCRTLSFEWSGVILGRVSFNLIKHYKHT